MEAPFPIHPAIVHFPIALLLVGFGLELAGRLRRAEWMRRAAAALLVLAALASAAAFLSGKQAEEAAEDAGVPDAPIESHEAAGTWTMILAALAAGVRLVEGNGQRPVTRWAAPVALALYAAAAASASLAGYRGGELVYKHGAGVRAAPAADTAEGGEHRE